MASIIINRKALKSLIGVGPFKIQDFEAGELSRCGNLWNLKHIVVGEVKGMEIGELVWGVE